MFADTIQVLFAILTFFVGLVAVVGGIIVLIAWKAGFNKKRKL